MVSYGIHRGNMGPSVPWAVRRSGVREIQIPDGVEELCEECFSL